MSLWWLQPGWTSACCPRCGARIWPEGDPDWGACAGCFTAEQQERRAYEEAEREAYEAAMREQYEAEHGSGAHEP